MIGSSTAHAVAGTAKKDAIKVMVIDDAVVVRGLVQRWLDEEANIQVVAVHRSAREAIADLKRKDPDVVILDIEMPDMDGITALPKLLAEKRDLVVIMASTLTLRNAEISLKALSLGAADYVPKPETNSGLSTSVTFRRELTEKVLALGARARRGAGFRIDRTMGRSGPVEQRPTLAPSLRPASPLASSNQFKLRPYNQSMPKALVIGSSTGGPQALDVMMRGLGSLLPRIPVLITQHMPATFTTILAAHIAKNTGRPAFEAEHGMVVQSGSIYVARGGKHMVVRREGPNVVLVLEDTPPVNFCKPAVDPMFTSASAVWGASLLGVVLTGMGSDGAKGAGDIVRGGGNVIAQDEASSVVWGMPGATAMAGHCAAVLPLPELAPKIVRAFSGDRS